MQEAKQTRVFSAKLASRPMSGVPALVTNRKDLIQSTYAGMFTQPSRNSSGKLMTRGQTITLGGQCEQSVKKGLRIAREKQELLEENLQLKRNLNKMAEEMSQQKNKLESARRKSSNYTKKLHMEHEKQIYWGAPSSNLLAGVKSLYDQLKQKYEEKSEECSRLMSRKAFTKELECLTYIDMLERENKHLSAKLNAIKPSDQSLPATAKVNQYLQAQLELNRAHLQSKNQELESKLKMCSLELKDRNKKILFLERLVIEKDNATHGAVRRFKKSEKQCEIGLATSNGLKEQLERVKEEFKAQLEEKQKQYRASLEARTEQHASEMKQLLGKLDFQVKQSQYLGATIKELRVTNNELNKQIYELRQHSNVDKMVGSIAKSAFINNSKQKPLPAPESNDQIKIASYQVNGKRVQRRCEERQTLDSVRVRKVTPFDIEDIGRLLRYRLIASQTPIEIWRTLFEVDSADEWTREFMSMGEAKSMLTGSPFNLSQDYAELLARYLVEDSASEYVYCDDLNENRRGIMKSIFKNVIGEYETTNQELERRLEIFLGRYKENLQTMLKGKRMSVKQLKEFLTGGGIDYEEDVLSVMIGRMALKAERINELSYDGIWG